MSVDYESVLIYGYKIDAEDVKRIKEQIGVDKWYELCEKYNYSHKYRLLTDNCYYDSDYYFGITLGDEIHLDAIDSLCWYEFETEELNRELESAFDFLYDTDTTCPMMYHFIRVC